MKNKIRKQLSGWLEASSPPGVDSVKQLRKRLLVDGDSETARVLIELEKALERGADYPLAALRSFLHGGAKTAAKEIGLQLDTFEPFPELRQNILAARLGELGGELLARSELRVKLRLPSEAAVQRIKTLYNWSVEQLD